MKAFATLLFLILLLLWSCKDKAEEPTMNSSLISLSDSLNKTLHNYIEDNYYKGNILIAKGDSIIYTSSSGLANVEQKIPNNTKSIFEIASIGKSFTATLILQLVEEGKLSLNDSLVQFKSLNLNSIYDNITIKQILNHTSGIVDHDNVEGFFQEISVKDQKREELIALINNSPLLFEPGTDFRYSNFGYNILAYLIEDITKASFSYNLTTRIIKPLELSNTFRKNPVSDFAIESTPYVYNIFQESKIANPYSHTVDIGAGGIYSNIYDMLKWSNSFNNNELISQKSKTLMFEPNNHGWGFGWEERTIEIDSTKDLNYLSHGALANGYWGILTKVEDYTIVILSNHRPNEIILNNVKPIPIRFINENIIRTLYQHDVLPYKNSLARKFSAEIKNSDLKEVIPKLKENAEAYYYDENEFMVIGYELLDLGENNKGIEVFEYMLNRTKNFGLVNECLGDAHFYYTKYLKKAREFYTTALNYSPDNSYLTSQIKKINNEISNNLSIELYKANTQKILNNKK